MSSIQDNTYRNELVVIPIGNTKRVQKLFMLVEDHDDKNVSNVEKISKAVTKGDTTSEEHDSLPKDISGAEINLIADITIQKDIRKLRRRQHLAYLHLVQRKQHRNRFGLRF